MKDPNSSPIRLAKPSRKIWVIASIVVAVGLLLLAVNALNSRSAAGEPVPGNAFVGDESCQSCHAKA
ncbi:MAG TPA: hypothetical protein VGE66_18140, partial [Chitinophagaceae bacterium]